MIRLQPEVALLMECSIPEISRNNIARTYRSAIESEHNGEERIDWEKVNAAIIERWSKSGLQYIKRRAWKGLMV
jgi:hypothetical protein